ncbi:phage major tail tube protein [Methylopila sp. M107]|uniref:phage major tail tube protein n=1 Tax=Methylopila sp. M107 TaxID=1101190 RepID=UPI0003645631|nr:phage major tail tube protein [Methylopila sp. M107]
MDRLIMGANWWIQEVNQRLRVERLQLPSLTREMTQMTPGGGWFSLDVPGEIKQLEAPFSLNGAHEDVRSLFGREPGDWTNFFYYERLRDIVNGRNLGRVVHLRGLLNEVEQPEVTGKKGEPAKYKVGTIVLYKDIVNGKTVHLFDVFNNKLVINGVNYTAEHNRLIAA